MAIKGFKYEMPCHIDRVDFIRVEHDDGFWIEDGLVVRVGRHNPEDFDDYKFVVLTKEQVKELITALVYWTTETEEKNGGKN